MWCGGRSRVPLGFMRVGLWFRGAVRAVGEPGAVTESQNGGGTVLQRLTKTQLSHRLSHHRKANLKKVITEAYKIREEELKEIADEAAIDGDTKVTLAYEVLIEHKNVRAIWRKINFYLKKGYTGPLVQLCVTTPNSATSEFIIDGDDVYNRIIERNIKHFSLEESSPLELHSFLHTAISHHGTSDFYNRVLAGGLGEADKTGINFIEVYELLQHMTCRPHLHQTTQPHRLEPE